MAEKKDYYEVLGVPKTATEAEIKSAFRKKAKDCHPDLHPGDKEAEARFKELNEAAEILSDADKRAKYDQFGHAAFDPSMGGQDPFGGAGFGGGGFDDLFSTILGGFGGGFGGGGARSNGPVAGNDLRYNLTITFEEAAFGAVKEIVIPREENCATCGGNGAKPGTKPERCPTCKGAGQVRTQQNTIFGSITAMRPCSACGGTGQIIKEPCPDCKGKGRVRKNMTIRVNIPAGIDNGQIIPIEGEGAAGLRGGPHGDLLIAITVRPHKTLRRKGADLYVDMAIPFTVAALGGDVKVEGIRESFNWSIPAGTQPGTTFRMREHGVQRLRQSTRGDLFLTVGVEVPKRLSAEQKRLLEQFEAASGNAQDRTGKKNIFNKR